MKTKIFIVAGILILAFVIGITYNRVITNGVSKDNYGVKHSEGRVTVSLQPVKIAKDSITFRLSMNTHSVSLQKLDLKKLITLKTDGGEIHPSVAPKFSWHHGRDGTLIFKIKKPLKRIVVTVRDVPDVPVRTFEWDI